MSPVPTEIPRVVRPAEPDDCRRSNAADGQSHSGGRSESKQFANSSPASSHSVPAPLVSSGAEQEFMTAMQEYKKASGRMFPTWSEVLEVLKSLGYEKTAHAD